MSLSASNNTGPPLFTTNIADTGSTGHFFHPDDADLINICPAHPSIPVTLPNGHIIHSTHVGELDLPDLPVAARIAHIFPDLSSGTLISIGQLCDAGCTATFSATNVIITLHDKVILSGPRLLSTKLWHLNLPSSTPINTTPAAFSNAARLSATPAEVVAFAHAALFSPSLSTLCTALDNNFLPGFPGLSAKLVRKYPPSSSAMIKGHLDQSRQNQRSTKTAPPPGFPALDEDTPFPISPTTGEKTHYCYATCFESQGQIFTDQTGRFITPSSTGNNDLLILYDYDSNSVHAEPIKNKTGPEILAGYKRLHRLLCLAGLRPQLQRLDNECSLALKDFMREEKVDYQLVPPHVHRRNAAERAIRTFKNHFIAGLCSTDKNFPLHLWDRLLPQAILSLNLLRGSRINPKLSAWAQVFGAYDFNRTPIAPPGIRVLVHEKPSVRKTWSPHAVDGWYIGPALESYRCYQVWIWETRSTRICDTLEWFPSKVTMPLASSADIIRAAANDIIAALQNPSHGSPVPPEHDSESHILRQLAELLVRTISDPPATTLPIAGPAASTIAVPDPVQQPATSLRVADPAPGQDSADAPPAQPPAPIATIPLPVAPATQTLQPVPLTYHDATKHVRRSRRTRKPSAKQQQLLDTAHRRHQSAISAAAPAYPTKSNANLAATNECLTRAAFAITTSTDTIATEFYSSFPAHFALTAVHPDTGAPAEYSELLKSSKGAEWEDANYDEFERLIFTETIHFIHHHDMPKDRRATYLRIVVADKPLKQKTKRVRFTVGGDKVEYPGAVSTKTADLTTVKCLLNSVISTPKSRFATGDLQDFYLNTPMTRFEYMRIRVELIPERIMTQYALHDKVHNGHVYVEIRKGMYGLPQAGRIANDRLVLFLAENGYHQCVHTHGLFHHDTRQISFSLVVDDFGIKYIDKADAQHLFDTLNKLYVVTVDWTGTKYLGLTLNWNYKQQYVDISMPGYIDKALQRFQVPPPTRAQHSPHSWTAPIYGTKTQLTDPIDNSAPLSPPERTRLQEIIGTLLYYARAVDSSMLVALGSLAAAQSKGTQATAKACTHLLNYCATHPHAVVRYKASAMVLHVHSDASYLSEPQARSRVGGIHYLSDKVEPSPSAPAPGQPPPMFNGAVLVTSSIMKMVVSSAAEAEFGGLFTNAKDACSLRTTLIEMGHPQPPTPIQTDNSTAAGIANDTVKQRRSKAIDMRFYWVRDRVRQGQFLIHWKRGCDNFADYFTKHHPPSHHQAVRSRYLLDHVSPANPP